MSKLFIKKHHPDAKLPEKAHKTDAGADLFSVEGSEILAGEAKLIKTGISIQLPPNTEAQIRPRSGLALKHSVTVLNSPGTIDEEYRGEIGVILINHGKEKFVVEKHMKIAQMVVKPVLPVEIEEAQGELSETDRGTGGFGSTGNK
ncbi:dUTP diphosphatase [Domibacillus aminovorans]|uniref:dUTP diphosphatase n=1 Tax=Domibacillus aminovorans TaxID=29332 RepID=UPI003D25F996